MTTPTASPTQKPDLAETASLPSGLIALKPVLNGLKFTKMHGLGNDFVMLDGRTLGADISASTSLISTLAKIVCDRQWGIGADGLIIAAPPTDPAQHQAKFIYYNADGSVAEMCGNGIRCFALFCRQIGLVNAARFNVETLAGTITPEILPNGQVRVNMGAPRLQAAQIPVDTAHFSNAKNETNPPSPVLEKTLTLPGGQRVQFSAISMGNPHAVIFNASLNPAAHGPVLETHPAFPAKTNVEFTEILSPTHLRVVVWERGCGFTQACGTGACAVAVAAILNKHAPAKTPLQVELPGGVLIIEWDGTETDPVFMTGPATVAFSGVWQPDYLGKIYA
ncbi:MAG: diaminopimelate epimerase [Vampirovibrionales bacterium]|nr:diaminopimelate epimerase [Vampirovibrionales bacterium]